MSDIPELLRLLSGILAIKGSMVVGDAADTLCLANATTGILLKA